MKPDEQNVTKGVISIKVKGTITDIPNVQFIATKDHKNVRTVVQFGRHDFFVFYGFLDKSIIGKHFEFKELYHIDPLSRQVNTLPSRQRLRIDQKNMYNFLNEIKAWNKKR